MNKIINTKNGTFKITSKNKFADNFCIKDLVDGLCYAEGDKTTIYEEFNNFGTNRKNGGMPDKIKVRFDVTCLKDTL